MVTLNANALKNTAVIFVQSQPAITCSKLTIEALE